MACDSGNERLVKEGYLLKSPDAIKYITVLKRWQKKFFRLMDNGDLHYFDSDKSVRQTGTLHMADCQRIFDPKTRGIQFSYCMGLEVDDSVVYIKADNTATYNAWLEVMAAFAEKNEAPSAAPSSSPSPPIRRFSALTAEGRGHRGGESGESRTFSVSAKVRSKSADKSGWLYKTGPNNKGWNHRYFVLSNGQMSYYRTEKAEKSLGTIELKECSGVNQTTVKKGYGLTIQVPNRTYYIAADTEADQREWILALTAAISLLDDSKLSVEARESLVRSGSGSSGSSDLFSTSTSESHLPPPPTTASDIARDTLVLSMEDGSSGGGGGEAGRKKGGGEDRGEGGRRQEKDSVVQLLEAEVDALRGQVSSLREELEASGTVRAQLQTQLEEAGRRREREVHSITVDRDNLQTKLVELEGTKLSLESVNDSLRLQLDEVREASLEAEELRVQGELEETQVALAAAEDEVKSYQQELNDTQDLLQEIRSAAMDLQSELIRRGDFVPDTFHKMRSLSTTASELLASPRLPSSFSLPLHTHTESEERPATVVGYVGERHGNKEEQLSPTSRVGKEEEEEVVGGGGKGEGEGGGGGSSLAEERLKWQMEMENQRKEYEAREEITRERREEEVRGWKGKVGELEEKCREMRREVEKGKESDRELQHIRERVSELEGELSGAKERAVQLQVEKEKALADLRKLNRTVVRKSSKLDSEPTSPTVSDGRLEELSKQLDLVKKERDQLKAELEELRASLANRTPPSSRGGGVGGGSSLFLRKSRATVATSRHSYAAPTPLTNGQDVPVKPQRPSKAVITDKLATANQSSPPTRPRSRTTTLFHNLLHTHS